MDRDKQPNRRSIEPGENHSAFNIATKRGGEVMSAYDEIDGDSMFIIASVDSDRAWIAISDGAEIDSTKWR